VPLARRPSAAAPGTRGTPAGISVGRSCINGASRWSDRHRAFVAGSCRNAAPNYIKFDNPHCIVALRRGVLRTCVAGMAWPELATEEIREGTAVKSDMDTGSLVEKRLQLAMDPLATAEQLAELTQSGDHSVLLALSQRPDVPREIREKLRSQIGSDSELRATGGAYPRIHPTAIVSSSAQLGWRVTVGAYSIIHEDVIVGDDSIIGSHCEIGCPTPLAEGRPLEIGKGSLIRSHSVFYAGSNFGDQLVTGHRVTVREGTTAGQNLQIGTLSDIQGDCSIGDFVRFHSNVHIGKHSKIGSYVFFPKSTD
jgi:acetyltransferase-like isoleucine patch superfamily enzyme